MISIQILEPNTFIKFKRETFIISDEHMINSYGEVFDLPDDLTYLSNDEIIDALNQNANLLELALDNDLVYIRNMEGLAFMKYVESFN